MNNDKTINLNSVTPEEKEILSLLEKKGKYLYGNIFKELNLSQLKGAETIASLKSKGYVKNIDRSSYFKLTGELVK